MTGFDHLYAERVKISDLSSERGDKNIVNFLQDNCVTSNKLNNHPVQRVPALRYINYKWPASATKLKN